MKAKAIVASYDQIQEINIRIYLEPDWEQADKDISLIKSCEPDKNVNLIDVELYNDKIIQND